MVYLYDDYKENTFIIKKYIYGKIKIKKLQHRGIGKKTEGFNERRRQT